MDVLSELPNKNLHEFGGLMTVKNQVKHFGEN